MANWRVWCTLPRCLKDFWKVVKTFCDFWAHLWMSRSLRIGAQIWMWKCLVMQMFDRGNVLSYKFVLKVFRVEMKLEGLMQKSRDWRKNCMRGSGLCLDLRVFGSGFWITEYSDGRLVFRTTIVLRASLLKSYFFFCPTVAGDGKETAVGRSRAVTCTLSLRGVVVTLMVPIRSHVSS